MAEESFPQIIKRRREELGLTQAQLAERLGVHKQTVVKYEAGSINIPSDRLVALSNALGLGFRLAGKRADDDPEGYMREVAVTVLGPDGRPIYVAESRSAYDEDAGAGEEPKHSRLARNLPYSVRVFLDEFRLRITKGGATEEEVERAMQLLRSPSLFTWYSSGTPRDLPEEKVLQAMRTIAESVIVPELRERGREV